MQEVGRVTFAIINAMAGLANIAQGECMALTQSVQALATSHAEKVVHYVSTTFVNLDTVAHFVGDNLARYHQVVYQQLDLVVQATKAATERRVHLITQMHQ